MELTVIGLPSNSYAMTNCVYVHAQDFAALRAQSPFAGPESDDEVKAHGIHVIVGEIVFSCRCGSALSFLTTPSLLTDGSSCPYPAQSRA